MPDRAFILIENSIIRLSLLGLTRNKATFDAANANVSGAIIGSKFVQLLKGNAPKVAVEELLRAIGEG